MKNILNTKRREVLKKMVFTSMGLPLIDKIKLYNSNENNYYHQINMKGNINHSVCKWCYGQISLEEFSVVVKSMGIKGIDLIGPEGWPILKKYGLNSSMCNGA